MSHFMRFQVLMALSMKTVVFWTVALCSLVKVYWGSRGTSDEGSKDLWNISRLLPDYKAQQTQKTAIFRLHFPEKLYQNKILYKINYYNITFQDLTLYNMSLVCSHSYCHGVDKNTETRRLQMAPGSYSFIKISKFMTIILMCIAESHADR
jgi:hypothetical protein